MKPLAATNLLSGPFEPTKQEAKLICAGRPRTHFNTLPINHANRRRTAAPARKPLASSHLARQRHKALQWRDGEEEELFVGASGRKYTRERRSITLKARCATIKTTSPRQRSVCSWRGRRHFCANEPPPGGTGDKLASDLRHEVALNSLASGSWRRTPVSIWRALYAACNGLRATVRATRHWLAQPSSPKRISKKD